MIPTPSYDYARIAQNLFSGEGRADNHHVAKGFLAGAIGGLVATGVKSIAEKIFPPRDPDEDAPPATLANRAAQALAGERLDERQKAIAEQGMHWLFGTLIGGVYGAACELVPDLKQGYGLAFGATVYGVMHQGVLPAADLEEPLPEQEPDEARNEMITHLAYGFVTEVVRDMVRERLDEETYATDTPTVYTPAAAPRPAAVAYAQ